MRMLDGRSGTDARGSADETTPADVLFVDAVLERVYDYVPLMALRAHRTVSRRFDAVLRRVQRGKALGMSVYRRGRDGSALWDGVLRARQSSGGDRALCFETPDGQRMHMAAAELGRLVTRATLYKGRALMTWVTSPPLPMTGAQCRVSAARAHHL